MQKNVAGQKIVLMAFNATTGAPVTGDAANITAYVSKDGGTPAALTDTSAAELSATNAPGQYTFDVSQTESNADMLSFSGKSTTSNVKIDPVLVFTRPANFPTLAIDGSGQVTVGAMAAAAVAAIWDALLSTITTASSIGKLIKDNLDAAISSRLASGSVTVGTNNDKTGYSLSSGGVQAIWDAATSALTTVGSIGKWILDKLDVVVSTRSSHSAADVWAAGTRTLTAATNITSTGGTTVPQTGDSFARIGVAGAGLTALGDTRIANLDAAVSSRMATYTQPTGFLAATFPSDPADQSLIIAATTAISNTIAALNNLSEAGVRTALGMANANLDTQLGALPTNSELTTALNTLLTTAMAESYAADGATMTPAQALYIIVALLSEFEIVGTTLTARKRDGVTTAAEFELDSATAPTAITRVA